MGRPNESLYLLTNPSISPPQRVIPLPPLLPLLSVLFLLPLILLLPVAAIPMPHRHAGMGIVVIEHELALANCHHGHLHGRRAE